MSSVAERLREIWTEAEESEKMQSLRQLGGGQGALIYRRRNKVLVRPKRVSGKLADAEQSEGGRAGSA